MQKITIRKFEIKDAKAVSALIAKTKELPIFWSFQNRIFCSFSLYHKHFYFSIDFIHFQISKTLFLRLVIRRFLTTNTYLTNV